MKRVGLIAVFVFAIGVTVWSFSGGPPDGRTGAPGEGLCTDCHTSFPPNSGDGSLTLSGLPDYYEPSTTYALTVTLADSNQSRWGFELCAKFDDDQQQAGTITVTDATNTQSSESAGITYLKQTSAGTYNGQSHGPVFWSFDWTSPGAKVPGRVWFYVAGNAANGNNNNQGDYIYRIAERTEKKENIPSSRHLGKIILVLLLISSAVFVLVRRRLAPGRA
jgi:hypothetical protein